MGKLSWFTAGLVSGLTAAAVSQEMAKPPEQRTWKGTIAGVPYNFRVPEWADIASEYWNPDSNDILTPHVIGLGWGVNLAAVRQRLEDLMGNAQQLAGAQPRRVSEPAER